MNIWCPLHDINMAVIIDGRKMYNRQSLLNLVTSLLIVVGLPQFHNNGMAGAEKIRECFNGTASDPAGEITLTCPTNHAIKVDDALFGRNDFGACIIRDVDCFEKTTMFTSCEGLNNCTQRFNTYLTKCGYITVLIVSFECIPLNLPTDGNVLVPDTTIHNLNGNNKAKDETRTYATSEVDLEDNGDDLSETGLIIGCVIASVVTVVVLVIAIIMVVRRLMHYSPKDRNTESQEDPHPSNCMESTCSFINKLICFTSSTNPPDKTQEKSTSATTTTSVTSKTKRVAPVGQENSSSSETLDDPERSLTTSADNTCNLHHVSDHHPLSSHHIHNTDCNSELKSHYDIKADSHRSHETERENSCQKTVPYSNDMPNTSHKINQNNNTETDRYPYNNMQNYAEADLDRFKKMDDKSLLPTNAITSPNQTSHNPKDKSKKQKSPPKFDAVAIPNTEEGTLC